MKTLRSYILREHAPPFFVTMGGLTAVLLIGNIIKFAELVISKGVGVFDVLRLLVYLIPYMLSFTIPMACLIAIVLAFARLSSDYELIALRASGISPIRLVWPLLTVGLVASVILLVVNDQLVPHSHLAFRQQLKAIGIKRPTAYMEAGTFIKEFPPYVIFVYHVEGSRLDNVRIYEPQPNGPTRTIIAERGEFERMSDKRSVQLKLHDGTVDEFDPERPGSFYKVNFVTYSMVLRADQEGSQSLSRKVKELTFKQLVVEARRLEAQGIDVLPIDLELHRKIASSFAPLIFIAFGLTLGLRLHHHERLISFVWVLAIFIGYYLTSVGMNALASKGWLPAWLAMWIPNLAGGLISAALLGRTVRN